MLASLINKTFSSQTPIEDGQMRGLTFVTVVFDDWHGLRHPIGIVHEMKMADGQTREIFTFCCKGPRQPELALFVKSRKDNLATGLVLSHEDMDRIPPYLKKLPADYRDALLAEQHAPSLALVM